MFILISHFDSMKGPLVFQKYPDSPDNHENYISYEKLQDLSSLLDLNIKDEIFQIYLSKSNISTLNKIISLESEWSRGFHELIMISVVTKGFLNLVEKCKRVIEGFENSILEIPDAYKGFYLDNFARLRLNPEIKIISEKIFELLKDYYFKISIY